MKKFFKILTGSLLSLLLIFSTFVENVYASNGLSISASSSSVKEGSTFTVTVKASSNVFVEGLSLSCSGGTVVSGLGKKSLDKGETTTAKIKLTGDSCTVSVSGTSANYDTETEASASASCTVKKKATSTNSGTGTSNNNASSTSNNNGSTSNNNEPVEDTRSKENSLSSLKVSEGTLSPAFNASTTKYKVEVGSTVNKITLSATAKDSKASVSGTGEKTLKVGNNSFEIKCKAENGSVKTYKVDVHVDETPLVYTEYNDKKLGVVRTDVTAPNGFEKTTVTLEGEKVTAFHSNQLDKTVVYLIDEQNNKNYYLFDEEKGITSIFIPTTLLGRNVYIIDVNENDFNKEGMIFGDITVDGNSLKGWTYEDPIYANYELIIVMNEQGEKVIYQHEKTENSLQLYMTPQKSNDNSKIIYVLAGTTGLFALTTLFFAIKYFFFKNKKIKEIKNFYEKRTPETKQPE